MSNSSEKKVTSADRDAARERAVTDALRTLIRDLASRKFGRLPEGKLLDVRLDLKVEPNADWQVRFEPGLRDQVLGQIEGVEAAWSVYRPGIVHCFQCGEKECRHGQPREALDVFQAYDSTGRPQWGELAQVLLDAGNEKVHGLFEEKSGILAEPIRGKDLRARQLNLYGKASRTYAILGQVIAGYFRLRPAPGQTEARFAITFQAVEVRNDKGRPALELNTIVALPASWQEIVPGQCGWLEKARRNAAQALKQLESKVLQHLDQGEPGEARRVMSRVPGILKRLANDLEQGDRQNRRQTKHAKNRREIRRPVDKALDDLRSAKPERMFLDLKTSAIAVCGNKGRCHIFNHEGRHITSFKIDQEAVMARVRRNRWEPMPEDQRESFLNRAL